MKIFSVIFILCFFISDKVDGQEQKFNQCPDFKYVRTENIHPPIFATGEDSLKRYLEGHLDPLGLSSANGEIILELLIDSTGKACITYYINKTKSKINNEHLLNIINQMPMWSPASQYGKIINNVIGILLVLKRGKIVWFMSTD